MYRYEMAERLAGNRRVFLLVIQLTKPMQNSGL